jgi:predicted phage-related endonuclease
MTGKTEPFRPGARRQIKERFGMVPTTVAVPVLGPRATDEQWRHYRNFAVGASEVASMLGQAGAYSSPYALWWAKRLQWSGESTPEMDMGTMLEPLIGELWADGHPNAILARPGHRLYENRQMPGLVCTPDFIAAVPSRDSIAAGEACRIEPVETKAYEGGRGWGKAGTDEVPEHITTQVMVQCAILGAQRGHVARMQSKRVSWYTIEMDEPSVKLTALWATLAARFIDSVQRGEAPPVDAHKATTDTLVKLHRPDQPGPPVELPRSLRDAYHEALDGCRKAESERRQITNAIRDLLGDAFVGLCDGKPFVERRITDVPSYTVGPYTSDGLYPKGR